MKMSKAEMLNKTASSNDSNPNQIIKTLSLRPGHFIADIGSGGGYFSLRFADSVGSKGKVYAVDVNPNFLGMIRNSADEKGLRNIETRTASEDSVDLPENTFDLIFARNVFHHLPDRVEYFKNLKKSLKNKGKIAIVEHKKGSFFNFRWLFGHYVDKKVISKEMKQAGYSVDNEFDFLKNQSFTIFSLDENKR